MQEKIIIISGALFIIFIIICILIIIEINSIIIRDFIIRTDKQIGNFEFLLLSDFHNKKFYPSNDRIINIIKNYSSIDILIAGDLITCTKIGNIYVDNAIELIDSIRNQTNAQNIYLSLGNHELRMIELSDKYDNYKDAHEKFKNCLIRNNIIVLDNSYESIDNINIYGLSLYKGYFRKAINFEEKKRTLTEGYIKKCLSDIDKSKYNIVLSHNPDYSENLIEYGFDLVLSGHHHGGLLRLPIIGSIISPEFMLMPKYSSGLYQYKNKDIVVSPGLGEHTIRLRLNNKPEIDYIKIVGV